VTVNGLPVRQVPPVDERPATLAIAFAEPRDNLEIASENHRKGVGILYSILEGNQVATIGSVAGLGCLWIGLKSWDANEPLNSHHLRGEPHRSDGATLSDWTRASDLPAIDDLLHIPRPGDFVARVKGPRRRDHRSGRATPGPMAVEPAADGHPALCFLRQMRMRMTASPGP
jgi:hypothetical protein